MSEQSTQSVPFEHWLRANVDDVNNESAEYQGHPVTPDSIAVRYFVCLSMLIDTTWHKTEYYLLGTAGQKKAVSSANLMTLLGGWWSVPGIFYTPMYVTKNLRGGEQKKVRELIQDLQNKDSEKSATAESSFGPLKILIGLVALLLIAGLGLQVYIFIRKILH